MPKVAEVANGIQTEDRTDKKANFWTDKSPCWDLCNCPDVIKNECPVTQYQFLPCWEIEGTYCKLDDMGSSGKDTTMCQTCRVYKKYGNGEPVRLKLFGKGMDTHLKEMEQAEAK